MILFQNFLKIKYSVTFKQRKEKLIKKLFTTVFKLLTQKNLKTVIYTHILINETSKVSTILSMQFEKVIKIHILKVRIQKHKVKFKIVKEKENLKSFNTNKNIYKQKQGEKKIS